MRKKLLAQGNRVFPLKRRHQSAFSLVETLVAAAILVFALGELYNVFFFSIRALRAADNSSIANNHLVQRVNQIQRIPMWSNVTDPSYIQTLLNSPIATTTQNLPGLIQESVTLSAASLPYASPVPASTPSPTPTPAPFSVTRTVGAGGLPAISPSLATSLSGATTVKVVLNIQWQDQSGQSHTRQLSTILSNAAITR